MANKNFPGPNINRLIENDPQIIKIALDKMDWGSRPGSASMPKSMEDGTKTIKHVSNEK